MPQITKLAAARLIKKFALFGLSFPQLPEGKDALADEFMAIVGTEENGEKLAGFVLKGCSRCPSPIELRRIFSNKFGEPADGIKDYLADASDFMDVGKSNKSL